MGNLVADAMLDRVKDQGVTIAIRMAAACAPRSMPAMSRWAKSLTVLPFQNTVATFQIKGADISAALENGLSQIEEGGGRFPQVAGMKFSFDKSRPVGSRRLRVEVKEGEAYVPLDPGKTYNVVTNNFMRNGGDGYSVFKTKAENAYDYGPGLETRSCRLPDGQQSLQADHRRPHHRNRRQRPPAEPSTQTKHRPGRDHSTPTACTTPAETATPETEAGNARRRADNQACHRQGRHALGSGQGRLWRWQTVEEDCRRQRQPGPDGIWKSARS